MAKMFSVLLFVSFSCLSEFGTTCAVYIEQNTTYRNDYGVSSKPTTTYIDDGGVSSEQTTTYIDDGGVSSKQTTTYIDDGGVSSDQTTTYIDDGGVSSEQTTTYIDNGGVSSEQTTTYIDDDGVSSKPTTTYIDDGGVSSEQTTTYIDDDGVSSKQTTTYIDDGGVSSEQTTTYIHNGGISSEQTTTYIDHGGISSEQTTKFTDDYGVVSEQTTTYIDDDNVSSEQTTNYMYNYGVSLKTDIEINSVEKIKYTNRMKCEIIDLTDNVLPSASGMAYPVNKSGQSILIWFDDFNFLSLTISKNCVSLALHMFLRKIIDIAYLQDFLTKCPDGTFIQNMFCDSSLAYNVRFQCPDSYYHPVLELPNLAVAYLETAIAVEVTLVNGFMLYIFLQKENRTPVTLLLSALAISDATAAILMTILTFIAYQIYGNQIDYSGILAQWYNFDYPQCIMYFLLDDLKYTFHFVSVLITTLLCLQKTAALLFPMWSKRHLSNTVSVVCSVCIVIFCFGIFSPIMYHSYLMEEIQGSCCVLEWSGIFLKYTLTCIQ
ncbi:Hypothetical predicted protein [Mytilus galloprovincialis]|uniref:G-protein coupled receptors family 1 profile domain-containing protein n=1 Tax=Mytilus galloprovincialis TaxID=29158 RepID=A0A8B6C184_MYTGA|nr:Hypothetical predicted protein [Mytilus galloprovincialis]